MVAKRYFDVTQKPTLFQMKIRENIGYSCVSMNESDISEAAEIPHCNNFIDEFSEEFNILVGEKGLTFSGDQKQRV
jgi:ATP-binding cassette subfamily B protein